MPKLCAIVNGYAVAMFSGMSDGDTVKAAGVCVSEPVSDLAAASTALGFQGRRRERVDRTTGVLRTGTVFLLHTVRLLWMLTWSDFFSKGLNIRHVYDDITL